MSASTVRATVRLGEGALRELRAAEQKMQASRAEAAHGGVARRTEEYAQLGVSDAVGFGKLAARCDALSQQLPVAELERAQAALATDAAEGALGAAAARIDDLERSADLAYTTSASQQAVIDAIVDRTGAMFDAHSGSEGASRIGTLRFEGGERMPLTIHADPASPEGKHGAEQRLVFHTANSDIDDRVTASGRQSACERQHAYVRRIAAEFGAEMAIEQPPSAFGRAEDPARAQHGDTRGAG